MVALSSTETSPDVSGILGIEKEETKAKGVLGEFPYICDMRQKKSRECQVMVYVGSKV